MIDPAALDNVYTFVTSSKGGLRAIGELCKTYGKGFRQNPGQVPIVTLGQGSYLHPDKSRGRVRYPIFAPAGWVRESDFAEALAVARGELEPASPALPSGKPSKSKKF
jgi:hypothetical protein